MKPQEKAIQALGELSDADRAWIVERLSPKERAVLLSREGVANSAGLRVVGDFDDGASQDVIVLRRAARTVAGADALTIAEVLSNEPAWIAHALLAQSWLWTMEVRNRLPQRIRSELDSLDKFSVRYAPKILETVTARMADEISRRGVTRRSSATDRWLGLFRRYRLLRKAGVRA